MARLPTRTPNASAQTLQTLSDLRAQLAAAQEEIKNKDARLDLLRTMRDKLHVESSGLMADREELKTELAKVTELLRDLEEAARGILDRHLEGTYFDFSDAIKAAHAYLAAGKDGS